MCWNPAVVGPRAAGLAVGRPRKPRLRKLRLFFTVVGFGLLAFVSAVFGMAMSVTHDLPKLENRAQFALQKNSYLYDDHWRPIGILEPPTTHQVIDSWQDISQAMVHAIVAVEDKRFWTDPGSTSGDCCARRVRRHRRPDGGRLDDRRAVRQERARRAGQPDDLREAPRGRARLPAGAHWPRSKILTEYLNTIYFGEGAYGIESAARVYFGSAHGYNAGDGPTRCRAACGDPTP